MNLSQKFPIYVFGTGAFGRDVACALVAKGYNIHGFVSNTEASSEIVNVRVYRWDELEISSVTQILIAILNPNFALSMFLAQARACNAAKIFMPWDFYGDIEDLLGWRFWLKDKAFLSSFQKHINSVLPLLHDDVSRTCLMDVFKFRTGNFLDYSDFTHEESQYFNRLTIHSTQEISGYLDIGAYHGENLRELEAHLPLKMAMLFEPDRQNFHTIVQNHKNFVTKNIHFFPMAVSDQNTFVSFDGSGSESSGISSTGETKILCVRLDDVVPANEKIDFIKMDVEGAELSVLKGAKNVIETNKPVLAISLYHNWDDLWTIPNYFQDVHKGYDLLIRQHMKNSFDLVLYAVPR
jgi:FkbM family methyltransferase